jgi:hypothetical protein
MKWDFLFRLCAGMLIWLAALTACREDITGEFNENSFPDTRLFIHTAETDTLNYTSSIQKIYWDGSDSDGFIKGFYYTWLVNPVDSDWVWTTERALNFPLKITGQDTIYLFQVKSVDNKGDEDPTPARQYFPIKNTAPTMQWLTSSLIPDTTFTVASFSWNAADLDGDSSIAHFEYALDDTSQWRKISGYRRNLTLTADSGLTAGAHSFYIRSVDIAGSQSPVIRMPQTGEWIVKEPRGRYLLIDDFANEAQSAYPDKYYKTMLGAILAQIGVSDGFDYWNIENQFPASRLQFIETMKLFDRVIWYTDLIQETDNHFITAQVAIPEFLENGGKIIYSVQFNTGFGSLGSPLEFSPVDSLGKKYNYINTNSIYYPEPTGQSEFYNKFQIELPQLKLNKIIVGVAALKPKATSLPLYRYDDAALTEDPIFIMLGLNDNKFSPANSDEQNKEAYDFVFSGTPLHYLQGNNNLDELFRIIFEQVFKP